MPGLIRCRIRPLRLSAFVFGAMAAMPLATSHADPAAPPDSATPSSMTVHIDHAEIMKLPDRTATVIIGNPLIADANVQQGGFAVVTPKSYGGTNIIALDKSGATLLEQQIMVVGPTDSTVLVYRGVDRETYSCSPNCERRLTIGDAPASVVTAIQTLTAYSGAVSGNGPDRK